MEEMFSTKVAEGALFYGETRRREEIEITEELRQEVIDHVLWKCIIITTGSIHRKSSTVNPAVPVHLKEICLPKLGKISSVKSIFSQILKEEDE